MKFAKDFKTKLRRLLIGFLCLLLLGLLLDKLVFVSISFKPILRFGLGSLLIFIGMALPAMSGRQLTMYGRSNHDKLPRGTTDGLVTQGIYAHLRHPAFQGFLALTFGIGFLINSPGFAFVAAPLADAYIFYFALKKEEDEGFLKFGCDYEKYRLQTPAFLPRFLFGWTMKEKFHCPQ